MNDDIVTRLREQPFTYLLVCREAADEIERLRKQLNLARRDYDMEVFGESDIDENGVFRD